MNLAANAVSELFAPRPSPQPPHAVSDDAASQSFEQHLDAAAEDEDAALDRLVTPPEAPEATSASVIDSERDPPATAGLLGGLYETRPRAAPPTMSLPLLAQLLGGPETPAPTPVVQTTAAASVVQPPPTPAPTTPFTPPRLAPRAAANTASDTPGDVTPDVMASDAPPHALATSTPAPTADPAVAANVIPPPPQRADAPPQVPPPPTQPFAALMSTPPPSAEGDASLAPAGADVAAPEAAMTPLQTQAQAKAETGSEDARPAAPAIVAPKAASKSAPAAPVAKEAATSAPAVASDAAMPAPAPSIASPAGPALAGSTQHAVLDHGATRSAPAATQVGHEIIRRFNGGGTRFEVRLDPPELGRVEVRLDVSRDNRVTAIVAADSPQTLTELARHARELEQTLQSAGLELADNGLSFDLRQGDDGAERALSNGPHGGENDRSGVDAAPDAPPPSARPIGYERWRGVRVDMMV